MKRFFTMLLASVLALSAAACSAEQDKKTEKTESVVVETTSAPAEKPTEKSAEAQALVDKVVQQNDFSGVVYITKNGQVLCQSATGLANKESGKEITIDSLFCIGSVSKQFASSSIMLLKEQGKLSVDDTLDKYFPAYEIGKEITVKNLLTMRSGIPDHTTAEQDGARTLKSLSDLEYAISSDKTTEENRGAILEWMYRQPLNFTPDTQFEYCNTNYFLLAQIVEDVSGQTYEDFVRENIFTPLGMSHTGFIADLADSPDLAEENLSEEDSEPYLEALKCDIARGAGDIISNAKDMDLWLTALRENKIVSPESFEEMTEDYSPEAGYGYGLMLNFNGGVGHSGMVASYSSFAYINLSQNYNFFAVTNDYESMFGETSSLAFRIIEETV